MKSAYENLCTRYARLGNLNGAAAVLNWDAAAMMPNGGAGARAEQVATLALLNHELLCAPEMAELLEQAEAQKLSLWDSANLREMRLMWRHATALPGDLVAAMSKAGSACEMIWRSARETDTFSALQPFI